MIAPAVGVPFWAEPTRWWRGPARFERGLIVLDRRQAEEYPAGTAGRALVLDLAAVRRPQDALAFVRQHGPLWHGPDRPDVQEPWPRWQEAAAGAAAVLAVLVQLQDAVTGDRAALAALRHLLGSLPEAVGADLQQLLGARPDPDALLLATAATTVAHLINQGLAGVEERVEAAFRWTTFRHLPRPPAELFGDFALAPRAPTLLALAYHQLALLVVGRVPLRTCAECGRVFDVHDQRQQFCSPTCASRARQRRWRHRKEER